GDGEIDVGVKLGRFEGGGVEEGCIGELGADGCEIWAFGVGSGVRGEVRVEGMTGGLF
ncbi:hypothetical protein A2U01_0075012, partial [Trifolium medium]|nr:hypothetical protein [Trifolium medium]